MNKQTKNIILNMFPISEKQDINILQVVSYTDYVDSLTESIRLVYVDDSLTIVLGVVMAKSEFSLLVDRMINTVGVDKATELVDKLIGLECLSMKEYRVLMLPIEKSIKKLIDAESDTKR